MLKEKRNCSPIRTAKSGSKAVCASIWNRNVTGASRALNSRWIAAFDLFYRPSALLDVEEELAIDEGEAEMGFYEGEGMELEEILREQILLLLPMQRVCSPDCKGICPVCGRNRNEAECHCTAEPVPHVESADDRWKALRKISLG